MTVYGYARVSTTDQSLDIQIAALRAAGCEKIRSEKQSGTSTNGRQELKTLLEFIDAGDELMVTRIDRLARSIGDLQDIVRALKAKGVALRATEQPIRYQHRSRQGVPRHARRVRGVRDQPTQRAADGRHCEG